MTPRKLAGCSFSHVPDGVTSGRFAATLALSIALHAALLAGLPDFRTYSERPAAAPLNARLEPGAHALFAPEPRTAATAPAERSAPAALAAAASAGKPTPAARVTAPDRTEPTSPAAPARAPAAGSSATNVGTSAGTNEKTNGPAAPARDEAPPALALGTPTLAPRAGDDALDPGSLAQYRLALIGAARRHKVYPPLAIDRALEGRVEIRLVVGGDGELAAALVKRSSGHELLDRQALETLREARVLTPIPPALRSREFVVEVPILYELKTTR